MRKCKYLDGEEGRQGRTVSFVVVQMVAPEVGEDGNIKVYILYSPLVQADTAAFHHARRCAAVRHSSHEPLHLHQAPPLQPLLHG